MRWFSKIAVVLFVFALCRDASAGEWSSATEFRLIESSGSAIGVDFEYRSIADKSLGAAFAVEWGTQSVQKSVGSKIEDLSYYPLMLKLMGTFDCTSASCLVWELGGGASYVAGDFSNWNPLFHVAWGLEFQHSPERRLLVKIGARGHTKVLDGVMGSPDLGSGLFLAVGSRF